MRGTQVSRCEESGDEGIIPAYAGKTNHLLERWRVHRDHPRICGEHEPMVENPVLNAGSSPRMRGTPGSQGPCVQAAGIIPAYAGNTTIYGRNRVARRDHPRVCGEHCAGVILEAVMQGSSPRMRGTRFHSFTRHTCSGIIPAYAGNT